MDSNSWEIVDSEAEASNSKSQQDFESDSDKELLSRQSSRYGQNVKNYETEWRDLVLLASEADLTKLKELAVSGELKVSKFRSVCWNVLLGALNNSPETWIEQRNQQRKKYREIKQKHILDPHSLKKAEEEDNPLSQSKDSIWNQHFRDTELRNLIRQDVVRTNPNVDFYRKEHIQEIMIDLLFCYAREYPTICYRQGMHEIVAPLIFVLHCDHQNLGHIQEETDISLDSTLELVLNPIYLEEDSYTLFRKIMNSLELFYRINDMTISESGQLTNIPDRPDSPRSPSKKSSEIEVVHQLNIIRDKIFAKQDLHLHNHLLKLEIPLALFGIRWLRLLFGREFNLLDLLILWDAIFGVGEDLIFTYYIVVAMLIHVRDKLLSNDYTSCLTLLMRYPQNADVMLIIRHALFMISPEKYQCPANAFVYVINSVKQHHKAKQSPQRLPHSKIFPASAIAAMAVVHATDYRTKPLTPRHSSDEIRQETAKVTVQQVKKTRPSDDEIVDGFKLDDPQVLKMELQDSYNIMTVSRIKLLQYVTVLRKYIPGNQVDELHQTLDGIEELCSLLKPKHQYLFTVAAPVDPAFEADDDDTLEGAMAAPRSFPLSVKKPTKQTYEVPNNRVSKNASQMLQQNRKEVEMNVIRQSAVGMLDPSQYPQNDPVGERRNSE